MNWMLWGVVAWICGIVMADTLDTAIGVPLCCLAVLCGLRWRIAGILGICVLGGCLRMQAHLDIPPLPIPTPSTYQLTIHETKQHWQFQQIIGYDRERRGYIAKLPLWHVLYRGQTIQMMGTLQPIDTTASAWNAQLKRRNIIGNITQTSLVTTGTDTTVLVSIDAARRRCQQSILQYFSEPTASIVAGMLLGINGDIHADVEAAFRRSGTTHILVISGWNITIVATISQALARRMSQHRLVQLIIPLLVIISYVLFTGASAAVVRAGVMGCILVVGRWVNRPRHVPTIIAAAVLLITAADPASVWDIGMQLSTLATAGLVVFATPVEVFLRQRLPIGPKSDWIYESLASTLAAQIPTLPIMLSRLGVPSPWSILANVVITPVVPYAMLVGTVFLVIAMLIPWLAPFCAWMAAPLFGWIIAGSIAFARLPGGNLMALHMPLIEVLLHCAWIGWAWHHTRHQKSDSMV